LLLDEPTSHLDITHQVQVLNLLQRLNHEMGLTVLMIIHDLNLASEYCDYLLMMKNGNLHCQGTPFDVLTYQNIEQVYGTLESLKSTQTQENLLYSLFRNVCDKKLTNKMAEIFVVRHGETVENSQRICQGQTEGTLTSNGIAQAEACCRRVVGS
jgi:ABC-type glutathione transport system ATPase component